VRVRFGTGNPGFPGSHPGTLRGYLEWAQRNSRRLQPTLAGAESSTAGEWREQWETGYSIPPPTSDRIHFNRGVRHRPTLKRQTQTHAVWAQKPALYPPGQCRESVTNFYQRPIVIAIYPGSFDPVTLGHIDLIERGCYLFDRVIVAVLRNPNKMPLFTVEERLSQIRQSTSHLNNVEVAGFEGLTVDYAKLRNAQVLLRGLRVLSDFEMELQMAHTNKTLSDTIETVFLATSNEYSFLSSSVVKEIAKFGGSVDHLVPKHVAIDIHRCYARNQPPESKPTQTDSSQKVNPPRRDRPE